MRVLITGSAAEYGLKYDKVSEESPLNPLTFYGMTKVMYVEPGGIPSFERGVR